MKDKLSLFHAFGIEAEYMIVRRDSLDVDPSASFLLTDENKIIQNELTFEKTAWSNELASHLIEMKTNGPVNQLDEVESIFHKDVLRMNSLLKEKNLMLMPTAMHPWMDPNKEFVIWPHENQEIYNAYDEIFNCKGHGWSNLQSVHINLGYSNEEEFESVHAAIRILLPLIPALAASSPILESRRSKYLDTRLFFYFNNQKKISQISGDIIPEIIKNEEQYRSLILEPMYKAIASYDPNQILQDEWLNSRGAIARFDRSAIEIRLMDIQECPKADLSLVKVFIAFLQHLIEKCSMDKMNSISNMELKELLDLSILHGSKTIINNPKIIQLLGYHQDSLPILEVFRNLPNLKIGEAQYLNLLSKYGSLSERILTHLKSHGFVDDVWDEKIEGSSKHIENQELHKTNLVTQEKNLQLLKKTYTILSDCLDKNEIFLPT